MTRPLLDSCRVNGEVRGSAEFRIYIPDEKVHANTNRRPGASYRFSRRHPGVEIFEE
jgi:hypothetical protein